MINLNEPFSSLVGNSLSRTLSFRHLKDGRMHLETMLYMYLYTYTCGIGRIFYGKNSSGEGKRDHQITNRAMENSVRGQYDHIRLFPSLELTISYIRLYAYPFLFFFFFGQKHSYIQNTVSSLLTNYRQEKISLTIVDHTRPSTILFNYSKRDGIRSTCRQCIICTPTYVYNR